MLMQGNHMYGTGTKWKHSREAWGKYQLVLLYVMVHREATIALRKTPPKRNMGPPLQSRDYISTDKMDREVEWRNTARLHWTFTRNTAIQWQRQDPNPHLLNHNQQLNHTVSKEKVKNGCKTWKVRGDVQLLGSRLLPRHKALRETCKTLVLL